MQALQGSMSVSKDKRSLRDIQEEERARQQEDDFLKWWTAEEERVRLEMVGQQVQMQGRGRGRGQGVGTRGEANNPSKKRGGRARARNPKVEAPPEKDPSGVVTEQQQQQGPRRPRQREKRQ